MFESIARATARLALVVVAASAGCVAGSQCLRVPASSKVSKGAVATCRTAVESDLDRRDTFLRYIQLLRVRGDYEGMSRWSRRILEHDSSRTDARFFLAVAERKLGDCDGALKDYQAYAKANPADADPYFGMALCYEQQKRATDAIEAYRTYLKKEKRKAQQAWRQRANQRIAALQGSPAPASTAGGAGGAKASTDAGRTAAADGSTTGSAQASAGSAAAAPATPAATKTAATSPPAKAQPKGAAAKATAAAPASADCNAHLKAIKADPFATDAYDRYAACAKAQGKYADIVRRMRIAVRDNPDFARGWLHMAEAHDKLGEKGRAKSAYAKACEGGIAAACGH